ncbi:MAG: DUF3137 domain-containing protein [Pseudomonadota bacterium]
MAHIARARYASLIGTLADPEAMQDPVRAGDAKAKFAGLSAEEREVILGDVREIAAVRQNAIANAEEIGAALANVMPTRPEFQGLRDVYVKSLAPFLATKELRRAEAATTLRFAIAAGVGLFVVVLILVNTFPNAPDGSYEDKKRLVLYGAGALGFGGYAYFRHRLYKIVNVARDRMVKAITNALSLRYERDPKSSAVFDQLRDWSVFPSHTRTRFQDRFAGDWRGAHFDFNEIHLEERRGSGRSRRWVTVFRGYCVDITFERTLFGQTVLVPKNVGSGFLSGFPRQMKKRNLAPVGVAASAFHDRFNCYANDQVEAHYILDPAFLERLIAMETAIHGKGLRAVFEGNSVKVAIECEDMFEIKGSERLDNPQIMARTLHELGSIFDLVDFVLKRELDAPKATKSFGRLKSA